MHINRLEHHSIRLLMLEDAQKGLADLLADRMMDEASALAELRARRQKGST